MASIKATIELTDLFSSPLMQIGNAMNSTMALVDQLNAKLENPIDSSKFDDVRQQIDDINAAISDIQSPSFDVPDVPEIEPPPPVEVPIEWQSDTLDVFTNIGVERFQSEVQSANSMLNTLNQTQKQIAQTAASTNLFPENMVADMNNMQTRLQAIKQRIEEIENNPINMGTDAANNELEQLRAQLNQAVSEQQELNTAVDNMDVKSANDAYLRLSDTVHGTERYIRDNVDEQGRFNSAIQEGVDKASNLQSTIAKAVGAFAGVAGIKKAIGWIQDTTAAFDTQYNAETQLISVLANMLDADYVAQFEVETNADTSGAIDEINAIQDNVNPVEVPVSAKTKALTTAFDQIKDKASEIQSMGIYGDEDMIAAGAEFATYFKDVDAITTMMDTLSNYAIGMSGGGKLDKTAMVDYATNLGKVMSGSYDAMTKKGFEFTDAQKHVIEGTATEAELASVLGDEWADMSSDMQAAAAISQVIDESWAGLYETMSNTPQGKIIQLTNAWSDMKEVIGGQLYPYVIAFVDTINNNWGTITTIVNGITQALKAMMGVLNRILQAAISVAQGIADHWSIIAPIIGAVTAALIAYNAALAIYKASQAIANGITAAAALAKKVHAAALMMETGATFSATAAQYGFNAALYACPIVWIIALIIALVALLYVIIGAINEIAGTSISATGVIMSALATIGALILNGFILAWNIVASFVEFLVNVWKNPEFAIKAFVVNVTTAFLNFCLSCVHGTQGAVGVIVGIWYAFVQAIKNIVATIWNAISALIEVIVNGFNSGIYQVKSFFVNLAVSVGNVASSIAQTMGSAASAIANMFISAINVIISGLNKLIDAINMIPGVNIGKVGEIGAVSWDFGASAISNAAAALEASLGEAPAEWKAPVLELGDIGDAYEQGKEIGADLVSGWESSLQGTIGELEASVAEKPADYWKAPKLDYINLSDAAIAGYEFGEGLANKVKNLDDLFGITDIPSPEDYADAMGGNNSDGMGSDGMGGNNLGDMGSDVGDIANDTGSIADSLDVTEEDLKYLRDIAEQEAINRFTTAEIHIEQTNNNSINSDMDLDGVVAELTDAVNEAVESITEGVHE